MKDLFNLIAVIRERIKEYGDLLGSNEMLTRYVLIDPILRVLGWNTEDPKSVRPEEKQESGKPDYVLYHNGKKLIAIEAKSYGKKLNEKDIRDYGFKYCWANKIPYLLVTDGNIWRLYDARKQGGRLLMKINIMQDSSEDIVKNFLMLWKPLIKRKKLAEISTVELSESLIESRKIRFKGPIDKNLAQKIILYVLYNKGIPLTRSEIVKEVKKITKLTDHDKEKLKSGYQRWEAIARWNITELHRSGLIDKGEDHTWVINKRGVEKLKEWLLDMILRD
ncbi:MAG: hypothetical protein J7L26_03135 [Candidatus Aminicenantes bacterium]|nr:hypothetical protein [Candidatus Aminicenantes bacterium]